MYISSFLYPDQIQKPSVARVIVRAIRNGDPPGRFLKKNEKSGKWVDVGDKKAAEKTSQALREKTNEERDQHKPDNVGLGTGVSLPSAAASVGPTIDNGTQAVSSSKLEACVVPNPVGVEAIMSATAEVRGTQSSGPLSGELKAAAHGGIPLAGQTSSTALAPTLMVAGAASLPDNRAKATEVATNVDSALETSSPTVGTQHETKEKEKSCLSAEI